MKVTPKDGQVKIGIVLAGAVTAGAFTAGVLEYMLNSLKLWQKAYELDTNNVPKPNVVIDTMTGASAGSIAGAVTLLALTSDRYQPIEEAENNLDNLLYYTWVEFGLKPYENVLDYLFSNDDLEYGKLKSILNTSWIDNLILKLCDAFDPQSEHCIADLDNLSLPPFINQNIEILMTLSNLRGIPIHMNFKGMAGSSSNAAYTMKYHKAFANFKYDTDSVDPAVLPLDIKDKTNLRLFLDSSRASGAFPIGLRSVAFHSIPKSYIEANLKQIFQDEDTINPSIKNDYEFIAVDGGMTNNEPMAEALNILSRNENIAIEEEKSSPLILIDPFPNYISDKESTYDIAKDSVYDIIPQLIRTLRNQVLFKEKDIVDLFKQGTSKTMIWPTRYDQNDKRVANPIACGALGGFSGFFSKEFRDHDYKLGRKNCQNFLRYYFYQTEADVSHWSDDAKRKFRFKMHKDDTEYRYPVIPDYRITHHEEDERPRRPDRKFEPSIKQDDFKFPSMTEDYFNQIIKSYTSGRLKAVKNRIIKDLDQGRFKSVVIKVAMRLFGINKKLDQQMNTLIEKELRMNELIKNP